MIIPFYFNILLRFLIFILLRIISFIKELGPDSFKLNASVENSNSNTNIPEDEDNVNDNVDQNAEDNVDNNADDNNHNYEDSDDDIDSDDDQNFDDLLGPSAEDVIDMEERLKEIKNIEESSILAKIQRGRSLDNKEQETIKKVIDENPGFFREESGNTRKQGIAKVKDYIEKELARYYEFKEEMERHKKEAKRLAEEEKAEIKAKLDAEDRLKAETKEKAEAKVEAEEYDSDDSDRTIIPGYN
jgi:hypothetical protein